MQAIILCGGKGTRLRSVIGEAQKTMTVIAGEPFVVNIIKYIKKYGIDDIIFATGYKCDEVEKFFGKDYYFGMRVSYAKETEPLGTGGAIRNAFSLIKDENILILNGDTLFPAEIDLLRKVHENYNSDLSIACKSIEEKSRYGTIKFKRLEKLDRDIRGGIIESFDEKIEEKVVDESFINGGIYIVKKSLIETIESGKMISFEKELIPKWLKEGKIISGIISEEKFIDIGTPESLKNFIDENS